jgi:septum formation protein
MSDPGDVHPLWLGAAPLVLASGSRTRVALLEAAGIPVEVVRPVVDERALSAPLEKSRKKPERIAAALAVAKAAEVSARMPGRVVLGADQTLSFDGKLLHKPKDMASAARQLAALAGRDHRLHSAVAIVKDGRRIAAFAAQARLTMRPLSMRMIARYLDAAGDAVLESVGGYQLERLGAHLFAKVVGDHSTILGLPLLPTLERLRRLGLVAV